MEPPSLLAELTVLLRDLAHTVPEASAERYPFVNFIGVLMND